MTSLSFPSSWPGEVELVADGDFCQAVGDDGVGRLRVFYAFPHITERYVEVFGNNGQVGCIRFFCPLAGGGIRPHTVLALYRLQSALRKDATAGIFLPERNFPRRGTPCGTVFLPSESGAGGLTLEQYRDGWIRLTVDEEGEALSSPSKMASVCFNKSSSANICLALKNLGKAMRQDNLGLV